MPNQKFIRIEKKHKTSRIIISVIIILAISLAFQTLFMISLGYKINQLSNEIKIINNKYDSKTSSIEIEQKNLATNINDLSHTISSSNSDLKNELVELKSGTNSDFSGIIEKTIGSVVAIKTDAGEGTGFIISKDGYVVTNAHVLEGATYANAVFSDKATKNMTLIGYNLSTDIALLKINGTFENLVFENKDNIKLGEKVIAIGNPLGLSLSVTEGIVSGIDRKGSNGLNAYIQTDASLNPGNSGGPLIDSEGKVIGINNFKARAENIGFALESDYIVKTVNEISIKKLNMTIIQ